MKGVNRIEKTLSIFDKIKLSLTKGIDECNQEVSLQNEIMTQAEKTVAILEISQKKAVKVLENLEKITN